MIRRMRKADLPAAAKLAAELVRLHHEWDEKRFFMSEDPEGGYRWWLGKQLASKSVVLLVAELDGEIAGYLYGGMEDRNWALLLDAHGAIYDILVHEKFRRRGVARDLMKAGIEALEEKGAERIVLSTSTKNKKAQKLFESIGFRPTMIEMTRG
jgi:ribosomal protein S18 acetylase RimI-like enzyme